MNPRDRWTDPRLAPLQFQVLELIVRDIETKGWPPTLMAMARRLAVTYNVVYHAVVVLRRLDYLKIRRGIVGWPTPGALDRARFAGRLPTRSALPDRRAVVAAIRDLADRGVRLSRVRLARILGVTPHALALALQDLRAAGLLRERAAGPTGKRLLLGIKLAAEDEPAFQAECERRKAEAQAEKQAQHPAEPTSKKPGNPHRGRLAAYNEPS